MPLPRWLATFNRRVTNHVARPVAARLPGFGVVVHTGRRSGRTHRTPVNAFDHPAGLVVPLTYGAGSDWVRNVLVAGRAEVEHGGETRTLHAPTIVEDDGAGLVPRPVRPLLRAVGVDEFLVLRDAAETSPARDEADDEPR